jgi:hypothetical protein
MEDTWVGEPSIADLRELLPSETFPTLTASLLRAEPHHLEGLLKSAQAFVIARYRVVSTPALVDRR